MIPQSFRDAARRLKREALVAYFAARDPATPVLVKLLAAAVAAYAFSPIDLIPDFIPVLGLLDDLILIPLGVALVIKLLPPEVLESARRQADVAAAKPVSRTAAAVIVLIWLALIALIIVKWR